MIFSSVLIMKSKNKIWVRVVVFNATFNNISVKNMKLDLTN
jgi:hypothetical protein